MKVTADISIRLQVRHPYFRDGLVPDLQWRLPTESQATLAGWGARFVPMHGEAMVVFRHTNGTSSPLSRVPGDARLSFGFSPGDSRFFQFSDLERQAGSIWYASNATAPSDNLQLEARTLVGPRFGISLGDAPRRVVGWKLGLPGGEWIRQEQVYHRNTGTQWPMDLSGEADGAYEIVLDLENSPSLRQHIYKCEEFAHEPPLAVFEWFSGAVQNPGEEAPTNWQLNLPERTTFWRYFLVPGKNGVPQDLQIDPVVSGDQTIRFEPGSEPGQLPDGRNATLFVADQALPYRESSDLQVELSLGKEGEKRRLPLPAPQMLEAGSPNSVNPHISYSNIYCYL